MAESGTAQDCYRLCKNPVSERISGFKALSLVAEIAIR